MITIDFETRSEADLRSCGSSVYARHESTVLLCLAYHLGGETKLWKPSDPPPTDLFDAIRRGDRVEAHNVMFERLIWRHVCHERMGWPDVPESQWRCSMAACSRLGLPRRLGDATAVLDLSVQKDDEGRRIMLRLSKPLRGGGYDNTPAKLRRLYEYCQTDVDAEIGISRAIPGLPGKELQLWQLDQRINLRGIPIDRAAATRAMALIDETYAHSCRKIEAITDGAVKTPKQVKVLLEWLNDRGVDADNLRAETVTQLLAGDLPREAREVLTIRQQTALSSTAKLQAMIDRCDDDGRVRGNLVYHGAATGRWAGAGLQIQNFPRGVLSGYEIDALHSLLDLPPGDAIDAVDAILATPLAAVSSGLRSMIRAEPGKRLIVGDFASIEARVLAWIAGEQPLVEAFARGQDAYKQMASEIYGVPADEVDKEQRQVGKVAVLGCGYGMGAFVFQNACRIMGGVEITPRFARQVIKAYRKSNPEIVRLWRGVNKAAISAVRTGSPQIVGRLKLYMQDRWLKIRLPSGRELHYWDPELEEIVAPWSKGSIAFIFGPEDLGPYLEDAGIVLGEREEDGWAECHVPESLGYAGNMIRYKDDPKYIVETYRRREKTPEYIDQLTYMTLNSQTRRWERVRSYGGLLVENIVQATARDFLAESMLRVESKGYPIIASVHDEIVCEVEVGKGSLQEFENLMKQSPIWGKGCPIEVEGFETERYRK